MNVRNCKVCGKIFNYDGFNVCRACRRKQDERFQRVKEYLREYPGASINEVEDATDVSSEEIMEFWDPAIKKAGLDDTVLMTFTHSDLFKEFDVKVPVGSEVVNTNTAIEMVNPIFPIRFASFCSCLFSGVSSSLMVVLSLDTFPISVASPTSETSKTQRPERIVVPR